MLVTQLDLNVPIVRAMIGLLGFLHAPFQLMPTYGSKIPDGCIELDSLNLFVAGVLKPGADDIPTVEAIVRASKFDCMVVRLDGPIKGPPIWIDVIQHGSNMLEYHGGLDLYARRGKHSLLIDTQRSLSSQPHGLRVTPCGLMPTGELPRLSEIAGLHKTDLELRRIIWGTPLTPPIGGWVEGVKV